MYSHYFKEIVRRSGLLNKNLWEDNDSIMTNRGFTNEKELEPLNVTLNIPLFLDGRDQFATDEVKNSQTIASVRIHVDRAITRIKKFRQLSNIIPLALSRSLESLLELTFRKGTVENILYNLLN